MQKDVEAGGRDECGVHWLRQPVFNGIQTFAHGQKSPSTAGNATTNDGTQDGKGKLRGRNIGACQLGQFAHDQGPLTFVHDDHGSFENGRYFTNVAHNGDVCVQQKRNKDADWVSIGP